ncbi:glycosyltransferase [Nocardioides sp. AE5]|uniref:glycosyltransferase n=1 Tax=Nocardioides sp. AE5 TaxID=2962573 RepID=UPI0028824318|nr:glycosyltransferase [Nocardioides sp. AE5]MDT0202566.1 hypothetical protein [Nocardioides sp. AE5]
MSATLIVEPDPSGHRFQAVANVARVARRTGEAILLTSTKGREDDAFDGFLADVELDVVVVFDEVYPATREMARQIAAVCRERDVATVIVMDADQSLKKWWYVARPAFKGLARKPRVIFMLTRYPAKLGLRDTFGWKLRISKGGLALLSRANGTVHRFAGFAGRDDMSPGWIVKRARDPAISLAHSRDRAELRAKHGLDPDLPLIGIFGVVGERKNAPMILDAMEHAGVEGRLVLAGKVTPEVQEWLDGLDEERRGRIVVRPGFLTDQVMDEMVAAVDVVPLALTNNGPSGIMGKALAAGVPVVTAGSEVRAREVRATGGGIAVALTVPDLGAGIRQVLDGDGMRPGSVPPATADAFAETLLGLR